MKPSPPRSGAGTWFANLSHSRGKTRPISRAIQLVSRRVPFVTAANTTAATRSGRRSAYTSPSVTPNDTPTTTSHAVGGCGTVIVTSRRPDVVTT